jgi:hypothetical protein
VHVMDETAHFMDENVIFQSYGSKGHFLDETAKLMEKTKYQTQILFSNEISFYLALQGHLYCAYYSADIVLHKARAATSLAALVCMETSASFLCLAFCLKQMSMHPPPLTG